MRIKITATVKHYRAARKSRGKRTTNCLVARALKDGLGLADKDFEGCASDFTLFFGDWSPHSYALPDKAIDLVDDFDDRAANLPDRLPVSFFVSVPKKDLEAARAAKG